MASRAAPTQLAVVEIGYVQVAVPVEAGLKLVQLLQKAAMVDFDAQARRPDCYVLKPEPLRLAMQLISSNQVRKLVPDGEPVPGQRALPAPKAGQFDF